MVSTILSLQVKDYKMWKKVFNKDVPNHNKMDIRVKRLEESVDNPKIISLINNKKTWQN